MTWLRRRRLVADPGEGGEGACVDGWMDGSVFWSIGDVFAISLSPSFPDCVMLPNVMGAFIDAAVVAAAAAAEAVGAPCDPAAAAAHGGPWRR